MDATGVNTLVELVGDNAKVSVLQDDVAGDGGEDLFSVFKPAAGQMSARERWRWVSTDDQIIHNGNSSNTLRKNSVLH